MVEGLRLDLSFEDDIERFKQQLREVDRWALPYIVSGALNDTMFGGRKAEQQALNASFDRPVALTRHSVRYRKATKDYLLTDIYIEDDVTKGTPPAKYLAAEVFGGARRAKRHEVALRAAGILGHSEFAVPGRGAPVDSFGNLKGGIIEQMLSQLQAAEHHAGYLANETTTSRKRAGARRNARFFYARGGKGLRRGIYIKQGSKVRSFLIFVEAAPTYRRRYKFGDAFIRHAQRHFGENFANRFNRMVANGRIGR